MLRVNYAPATFNMAQPQRTMNFQYQSQTTQQQQQTLLLSRPQYLTAFKAAQQAQIQKMATIHVHKKLVIFDWDDTIFPTTALLRTKEQLTAIQWEEFGKAAYEMIVTAIQLFSAKNIYIVTNAGNQWVQQSIHVVMAKVLNEDIRPQYWFQIKQLVSTALNGHVISARALQEAANPKQATLWKKWTFKQLAINHFGVNAESECTVISIGDSSDEYDASLATKQCLKTEYGVQSVHLNRCKLERVPSSNTMMAQFNTLKYLLEGLAVDGCSCDAMVSDWIQRAKCSDQKKTR